MKPYFKDAWHKQCIYAALIREPELQCGPFEGGCLAFTRALQSLRGGEIHVIVAALGDCPLKAVFPILKLRDNLFVCAGCEGRLDDVLDWYAAHEAAWKKASFKLQEVRLFRDGDLPGCPASDGIVERIADVIAGERLLCECDGA